MKFMIRGRRRGKTTDLLKWMQEAPEDEIRVILCHTLDESMRVYRSTFDEESNPTWAASWQFVSAGELADPKIWSGLMGRRDQIVLGIDNLDLVLSRLLGAMRYPVGIVTATGEVVP